MLITLESLRSSGKSGRETSDVSRMYFWAKQSTLSAVDNSNFKVCRDRGMAIFQHTPAGSPPISRTQGENRGFIWYFHAGLKTLTLTFTQKETSVANLSTVLLTI